MNCFQNSQIFPLPTDCGCKYLSGAFDGENYYFTVGPCCEGGGIDEYDENLNFIRTIDTPRAYCALTYDPEDEVFWAAACEIPGRLFVLNSDLREIDNITLIRPDTGGVSCGSIAGVSYNCGNDTLLVAFYDAVWEINKDGDFITRIAGNRSNYLYTDVLSVYPYTILALMNRNQQIIIVLDINFRQVEEDIISCDYQLESLIFNPCIGRRGRFFALVTRQLIYSQLMRIQFFPRLQPDDCNFEICEDDDNLDEETFDSDNSSDDNELSEDLNLTESNDTEDCDDEDDDTEDCEDCDDESDDTEDFDDTDNNEDFEISSDDDFYDSETPVNEPVISEVVNINKNTNDNNGNAEVDELVSSLVKFQTSMIGILNTESEKLRQTAENAKDVSEFITVNQSVNELIKDITSLEKTLSQALKNIKLFNDKAN